MKISGIIILLLILFPLFSFGGDKTSFDAKKYFGSYLPAGSRYEGDLGSFVHIFTSTASFDEVKALLHQKGGRDRMGKLISKEYLPGVTQKDALTYKSYLGKLNNQWNYRLDSHRYNLKQGKWRTKTTIVFTSNRSELAADGASQNPLLPSIPEIHGTSQVEQRREEIKQKPKDVKPARKK